ncbi:MAG: hypothetical protein KKH98_10515, partial [Spirochaetes bacterium]|nr:hypothetical protein [Spirochaetota bacterium]
IQEYKNGESTGPEIKTKIEQQPNLKTEETDYYQTLFDKMIKTPEVMESVKQLGESIEKSGKTFEDLPAPLNTIYKKLFEGATPQQQREMKGIDDFVFTGNYEALAKDVKEEAGKNANESVIKLKIKSLIKEQKGMDLTDYQAEVIYKLIKQYL